MLIFHDYSLFFQGVTLTDLKEAERSIVKSNEPQYLSVQPVSPNITVTPAERGESYYYQVCVKDILSVQSIDSLIFSIQFEFRMDI